MDRQERQNDPATVIAAALQSLRVDMWTAMPAQVVSYNAAKQTCVLTVTIQPQKRNEQGVWANITIAPLPDVPVLWPGGGGACLTFPLTAGDEGIVVFGSRCINGWWYRGGIQPQEEFRTHNVSDGMFIPGLKSVPNVPANLSTTVTALRSNDGLTYITLDAAGKIINIVAQGGVMINGVTIDQNGNIVTAGDVTAGGSGAGKVTLLGHIHPGNNDPPTPGH